MEEVVSSSDGYYLSRQVSAMDRAITYIGVDVLFRSCTLQGQSVSIYKFGPRWVF